MYATLQRWLQIAVLLVVLAVLGSAPPAWAADESKSDSKTAAQSEPLDISGAVTQTYSADPSVQIGMIVALKDRDSRVVIPLKNDKLKAMLGVVIPPNKAPIILTPEQAAAQQVLVATSGRHNVVVSNQNGPIKVGDYITVSAVSGIGMKAGENETLIIGQAAGDFGGNANVIGSIKLKSAAGKDSTVSLGLVAVDIKIGSNPLFIKRVDYVPGFLAKIAQTVSGKPVSVARIYLSLAILLVISVITGNMLYSGIKSGMLAVGRNPLSKKSIMRSLIQTVIAGLIVFVAGVFAVYLLLKL